MRLRTELYPNRLGSMTFGFDDESMRHDAYAAHALVMAMNEQPYTTSDVYMKRANEIMTSWGYGED